MSKTKTKTKHDGDLLVIDGSEGEGGGQILRSSLALAAITGTGVRVVNVRGRRKKPGLLRQHLTAVRAVATISRGELRGDELRSSELEFRPGVIEHGEHQFSVGTAGSATLVLQTVLWPLVITPGRSRLVLEGGTHNPMAPPFDFIERVFLPRMRELGLVIEAELIQAGFYPAGGGRFEVEIEGGRIPAAFEWASRGKVLRQQARALVANLPPRIAKRELAMVRRQLSWAREQCAVESLEGRGPGNALCLLVEAEGGAELVTGFGDKGVAAETVAERACAELRAWLDAEVAVGEHLADQLLIPMALAAAHGQGCSAFTTTEPSLHTRTNADIIARFLPVRFAFEASGDGRTRVRIERVGTG